MTPPALPETNNKALWALVAGVIGLFCGIASIVAIVLSRQAQREIAATGGTQGGYDQARVAFVLGVVGLVLWIAFVLYRLS
ncbi:MAG: DUF4190 domain-containing protein [Nocardioidaceae bacterium]|nr:DUF4190 domain-containing protein [Nocardioidaceae bacterium]